jgi:hypothetical protein
VRLVIVAYLLAEAGDLGHVGMPGGQVAGELGEPVDDERGAGVDVESDGVHADGSGFGGLALSEADLGEADLVEARLRT